MTINTPTIDIMTLSVTTLKLGLDFLNKCSCSARALGVTKFTNVRDMILVTLCCAA